MLQLGDKLSIPTGRIYDFEQVLECEVISTEYDNDFELSFYWLEIIDESRKMKVYIQISELEFSGEKLLALYDTGKYKLSVQRNNAFDLSFINDKLTIETCPECGCEINISTTGTSNCPLCGHKEVLPCSACTSINGDKCDWMKNVRCTPFPIS